MALLPLLKKRLGRSLFLPAHGRGQALPREFKSLLRQRAGAWDLPELAEIGGPLEPDGAVGESQRESAAAMGADHCWYGVNGATGLLQAALLAIAQPGDAVLMPRNVHKSLIQACVLGDITPLLYNVPYNNQYGHATPPDGGWMKCILNELPTDRSRIKAAVLIHPTYQGYANDPSEIIELLQSQDLVVLVDEAHGSYFAAKVDSCLPASALHCGADLIVHSLHKSAAGIAQTAVLWQKGRRVDPEQINRCLGWLQTTSPSSLLLASCETAIQEWTNPRGINQLKSRINEGRLLAVKLRQSGIPLITNQDPLRIILHTGSIGLNGLEADQEFIQRGLIAELPEPSTLTFCLGVAKHKGLYRHFKNAWKDIESTKLDKTPQQTFSNPPLPLLREPEMKLSTAWRAANRMVAIENAEGEIASELICPYPPGIPLLIPGEKVDQARVRWLMEQSIYWKNAVPNQLKVMLNPKDKL